MAIRKARARWEGNLREGMGRMQLGQHGLESPYSFGSRFEDGSGTNPEELLGAAHAGCFSMALSAGIGRAGFTLDWVETDANVHFDKLEEGWRVTKIELLTEAKIPGISEAQFAELAQASKEDCPISKALEAVEITLDAKLVV